MVMRFVPKLMFGSGLVEEEGKEKEMNQFLSLSLSSGYWLGENNKKRKLAN